MEWTCAANLNPAVWPFSVTSAPSVANDFAKERSAGLDRHDPGAGFVVMRHQAGNSTASTETESGENL
jgi:hypothetical protein